jgi:hypothetical protein
MLAEGRLAVVLNPGLSLPPYRLLMDPARSTEPAVAAVAEWLVSTAGGFLPCSGAENDDGRAMR